MGLKADTNRYTGRAIAQTGVLFFGFLSFAFSGIVEVTSPYFILPTLLFGGLFVLLSANAVYNLYIE